MTQFRKNLVMGVVSGYLWHKIEPFFVSWHQHCPNSDCVVYTEHLSPVTAKILSQLGVTVLDVPSSIKGQYVNEYRWQLFAGFLQTHITEYQQVFLCDIRDVIFQNDVFSCYKNYEQYLGIALESACIKDSHVNSMWIRNKFGVTEYEKLKDNTIICSGTVWGTVKEIYDVSMVMTKTINSPKYKYCDVFSDVSEQGSDQGAWNFIVYNKLINPKNIIFSDSISGDVITIGLENNVDIIADNILNSNGEIAAIVHQYDRHEKCVSLINAKYCININITDINGVGANNSNEKILNNFDIAYLYLRQDATMLSFNFLLEAYFFGKDIQCWQCIGWEDIFILAETYFHSDKHNDAFDILFMDLFLNLLAKCRLGYVQEYSLKHWNILLLQHISNCKNLQQQMKAMFGRVADFYHQQQDTKRYDIMNSIITSM